MAMMFFQENDWLPLLGLKAPVDSVTLSLHLGDQVVVVFDGCPTWCAELDKGEFIEVGGVFFQEALNGPQTFQDPFGVVETVHTDPQKSGFNAEASEETSLADRCRWLHQLCLTMVRECDADRKWFHIRGLPSSPDREVFPDDAGFQCPIDGIPRSVPRRCGIPVSDRRYPGSCCNGTGCENR